MDDLIIERLLNSRTVEVSIVRNAPAGEDFSQQMKDFIKDLCTKLEEKTFILPLQGNAEVSATTLNHFKNALQLEDHPYLTAAVGVTVRVVQKYLDTLENQMPYSLFKSMLNRESCGNFGFVVPTQGLLARLDTLENRVETLTTKVIHMDTELRHMDTKMKALIKVIDDFIQAHRKSRERKRKRGEESPQLEEIAEERRSDDDEGADEGADEGERANPPPSTSPSPAASTPGRGTAPTRQTRSSSSSSTSAQQSAAKRPKKQL
eukprot:gene14255-10190_t